LEKVAENPFSVSSLARSLPLISSRSQMITFALSCAKSMAVALPIPAAPPVMIAILFSNRFIVVYVLLVENLKFIIKFIVEAVIQ